MVSFRPLLALNLGIGHFDSDCEGVACAVECMGLGVGSRFKRVSVGDTRLRLQRLQERKVPCFLPSTAFSSYRWYLAFRELELPTNVSILPYDVRSRIRCIYMVKISSLQPYWSAKYDCTRCLLSVPCNPYSAPSCTE